VAERLSLGKCGIESDYLVVGWPRLRIEEGLEGNTIDDGDEALRLFERVGLGGERCAHTVSNIGTEVAVRVALQGGELGIATGLGAKSNRHVPVQAAIVINR
jgi:hypothetical protein